MQMDRLAREQDTGSGGEPAESEREELARLRRQRAEWAKERAELDIERCRVVFPEEASMGLTPHSAAKAASLFSRSGSSPAVMRRQAAVSGPTPCRSSSRGAQSVTISVRAFS
ncbi:hypothetical protein GCM10011574_49090 [Microbispora bryophytorum]|uniref:Uncharacterized protein n=1 Tax=Microbispora bryophytorum TaxID=1460882 RepID=A0A8H9H4X8_9ACTN|nr:hypothetical protein GCM10011574_49090 [Microbispora bryophytorum]